jgi:hypothetical protein
VLAGFEQLPGWLGEVKIMTSASIAQWRAERNRALRSLDLDYLRAQIPAAAAVDGSQLLVAAHKARYECTDLEDHYRLTSAAWLRERGLGGMYEPLLPLGELPRGPAA